MGKYKTMEASKLSKAIIEKNCRVRTQIIGESMYPILKTHDIIIIAPVKISELLYGDIIVYSRGDYMVCHRIIKKHSENDKLTMITKGDNTLYFDLPLVEENLIGKVIAMETFNKKVNINSKSWNIFNSIIATYSVLFLLAYRRIYLLKKLLFGDRTNYFTRLGSKILFQCHHCFLKQFLNLII